MRKFLLLLLIVCAIAFKTKAQFDKGSYTTTSGEKLEGLIFCDYSEDHIFYKPDDKAKRVMVKIDDLKSFTITVQHRKADDTIDTLYVEADGDTKDHKKYFGKVVLTSPTIKIYYEFKANNSGGATFSNAFTQTMNTTTGALENKATGKWTNSGNGAMYRTVPMYQEKGDDMTYPLTSKNYIDILSKAVADDTDLAEQIQAKQYKFKDLDKIFEQYSEKNN